MKRDRPYLDAGLVATHSIAALIGAWVLVGLIDEGVFAISSEDARLVLLTAPVAAALASLILGRFIRNRRHAGGAPGRWLLAGVATVGITIIVSVVISSSVAAVGLVEYHNYMSRDTTYEFDGGHAVSLVLLFNAIGGFLSMMTILPAMLLATSGWMLFRGRLPE